MSSIPSELEVSRVQEIRMQIDELTQKQHREQLSPLEEERLHRLQLELIEKEGITDSTLPELKVSRVQEIRIQIDELTQKQHREQLSSLEEERLHRLQLELIEKEGITSSTLSELKVSRVKEISMQIDELTQKQYHQPLPKIEAERLHKLQLELIEKDFAAYQRLQQKLITRLSLFAIEKKYESYNFYDNTSKQLFSSFVAADPGSVTKTIQQLNPMWQRSEEITGNEYSSEQNAASSQDHQNNTFRKF